MSEDVTDVTIDVSKPETALQLATELCLEGSYDDAIELAEAAVTRFADAAKTDLGRLHNVLASAYQCVGPLERCAVCADAAIAALRDGGDEAAAELGVAYHTRAVAHLHQNGIEEAATLLDRAAEVLEAAGDEARVDFCSVLLTMAEVASATGANDEAIALCERVVNEMTGIEPESADHAAVLNRCTARAFLGLGSAFGQRGDNNDAKDYLERAVDFFDAGFGHGHPEMDAGLREVAAIYRALGDDPAALVIEEELSVVAGPAPPSEG